MYIKDRFHQLGLADFNQPIGFKMNPENRWIKKAETIPWFAIEDRYAQLFPMPVKPLRAALGSLIIECNHRMTSRRKAAKDLPIPNPWKPVLFSPRAVRSQKDRAHEVHCIEASSFQKGNKKDNDSHRVTIQKRGMCIE